MSESECSSTKALSAIALTPLLSGGARRRSRMQGHAERAMIFA
jgi:hypothetical protein